MIEWLSFDERQALDNMFDIDFCSGKNRLLDSYMMNKRKNRKNPTTRPNIRATSQTT